MSYTPNIKSRVILDRAWEHLESVPYTVSARWLFYRLYQDGIYTGKDAYKDRFLPLLSRARKRFYAGWRPWTLEDTTRTIETWGEGYRNERDFLEAVATSSCSLDKLQGQSSIIAVLFEANAMSAQFEHYIKNAAIRFPFGGDPSIPSKWKVAQLIVDHWERYRVPVHVFYFGDWDEKGLEIEKSAKAEILDWATMIEEDSDVRWTRAGLNQHHTELYNLPLSIKGKGYQWEALADSQAREIIESAVAGLIDKKVLQATATEGNSITVRFKERFDKLFGLKGDL